MTVITETTIQPGREAEWDRAYMQRLQDARKQSGWVGMELLIPEGAPNKRMVVGTWESKDAWMNWHQTDSFKQTREAMNQVTQEDGDPRWHRVVAETFDGPQGR